MGEVVRIELYILINPSMTSKMRGQLLRDLNTVMWHIEESGDTITCNSDLSMSYTGLAMLAGYSIPKKFRKHIKEAQLLIKYLEQAPVTEIDILNEGD